MAPIRRRPESDAAASGPAPENLVRSFLRAQNLEQMRRIDEAAELYEEAVAAGFDSAGPYDRLIAIYRGRSAHADVVRVADAALVHVRTYDAKREFYSSMAEAAREALKAQPDPTGPEF